MLVGAMAACAITFFCAGVEFEIAAARRDAVRMVRATDSGSGPISFISSAVASEIHHSLAEVSAWAVVTMTQAYTLNYVNHVQQMSNASIRFTDLGWIGFRDALSASGMLDSIIREKLVTGAAITAAPTLISAGPLVNGLWGWKFLVPMTVSYYDSNAIRTQQIVSEVIVVEQADAEHTLGVAQVVGQ